MTTNVQKAQRIVGGVIDRLTTDRSGVPVATRIPQALADAGRLMQDLPKPNSTLDDYPEWLLETEFKNLSISALEDDGLRVTLDLLDDDMETVLHPAQYSVADAKSIAYALLAAANYAEQEQDNV